MEHQEKRTNRTSSLEELLYPVQEIPEDAELAGTSNDGVFWKLFGFIQSRASMLPVDFEMNEWNCLAVKTLCYILPLRE